jgi:hypothetical protein
VTSKRAAALVGLVAFALVGFVAVLAAPISARPAADDVSIHVSLARPGETPTKTAGLNFRINVEATGRMGVAQVVTVKISLPAGLHWGTDAPDPTERCTSTQDAGVCTEEMGPNPAGTLGVGWSWQLVADRPGFYEISAAVEPTESDPDLSNNSTTFRFEVAPAASGGAGSGSSATVVASAVKLTPAKPKAGSLVAATVRVTVDRAPLRPSKVSCSGRLGTAALAGSPRARSGSATCSYRTPRTAKNKTLRGAVSFTARGKRFTKRFSTRLG